MKKLHRNRFDAIKFILIAQGSHIRKFLSDIGEIKADELIRLIENLSVVLLSFLYSKSDDSVDRNVVFFNFNGVDICVNGIEVYQNIAMVLNYNINNISHLLSLWISPIELFDYEKAACTKRKFNIQ